MRNFFDIESANSWKLVKLLTIAGLSCALLACANRTNNNWAPVEDRSGKISVGAKPQGSAVGTPLGGANSNSLDPNRPGYVIVRPGDTIRKIALENNVMWQDVIRWNNLENPNQIEPGQSLKVTGAPGPGTSTVGGNGSNANQGSRPVATVVLGGAGENNSAPTKPVASNSSSSNSSNLPPATTAPSMGDEGIAWMWPGNGTVIANFDEVKNKGIDLAGKAGDPVFAVADGIVIHAASLRGFGNLVILKHNNTYISAYGHNQTLLVKEDQQVKKGQKIAEMGNTGSDQVKLHFEIRRQGKPVDPIKYLPPRK